MTWHLSIHIKDNTYYISMLRHCSFDINNNMIQWSLPLELMVITTLMPTPIIEGNMYTCHSSSSMVISITSMWLSLPLWHQWQRAILLLGLLPLSGCCYIIFVETFLKCHGSSNAPITNVILHQPHTMRSEWGQRWNFYWIMLSLMPMVCHWYQWFDYLGDCWIICHWCKWFGLIDVK